MGYLSAAIKRFDVPGILAARVSDDTAVETTGPNIDRLRRALTAAVSLLECSGERSARIVFRKHQLGGDVAGAIRVYRFDSLYFAVALKPNLEDLAEPPEVLVTLAHQDAVAALERWANAEVGD